MTDWLIECDMYFVIVKQGAWSRKYAATWSWIGLLASTYLPALLDQEEEKREMNKLHFNHILWTN